MMGTPYKFKPRPKPATLAWLEAHVAYQGDDCLTWPYRLNRGYGQFQVGRKMSYAHRWMCEAQNGPPPTPTFQAAHSCGNGHKGCLNPRHLSWKTPSENQFDRRKHGTKNRTNGRKGKLRPHQVAQILALKGKKSQDEIASIFAISRPTVRYIFAGKKVTEDGYKPLRLSGE